MGIQSSRQSDLWRRAAGSPRALIVVVVIGLLLPFANKAFHMDDPLFVWSGRQIAAHPLDPYGFPVNWFGTPSVMWQANQNPPLTSYYIAVVAGLFGWSERALHLGFLPWSCAFALGCHALARRWCRSPVLAVLLAISSPVFLVSATGLMCDLPMSALWVWALVLWVRGIEAERTRLLVAGMALAGAALMVKYAALAEIPLMLFYGWLRRGRPGSWMLPALVPMAILGAYEFLTARLYGRGLFAVAQEYTSVNSLVFDSDLETKWLIGLAFLGGGCVFALFAAPLVWGWRGCGFGILIWAGVAIVAMAAGKFGPQDFSAGSGRPWLALVQFAVLASAGVGVVILCLQGLTERRDPAVWTMSVWVLGTFIFAVFLNWTVATRSFLPALPAVAILITRKMDQRTRAPAWTPAIPFLLSCVVSLLVAAADYSLAGSGRRAAVRIMAAGQAARGSTWFSGHWGFQYYMERRGAKALDVQHIRMRRGDRFVLPSDNSNRYEMPADWVRPLAPIIEQPVSWLATMSWGTGAGFYAADWGPLPFAFVPVPAESYGVFEVITDSAVGEGTANDTKTGE